MQQQRVEQKGAENKERDFGCLEERERFLQPSATAKRKGFARLILSSPPSGGNGKVSSVTKSMIQIERKEDEIKFKNLLICINFNHLQFCVCTRGQFYCLSISQNNVNFNSYFVISFNGETYF